MNYQPVTFIPAGSLVKVFIRRKPIGYVEGRDIYRALTREEFACYELGQITVIIDFDKLKPYLKAHEKVKS